MLVDQLCNETASLRLFYEIRQKYRCRRVSLRRPDRLLNGGELAVENARAGKVRQVVHHGWAEASKYIELFVQKQLGCARQAVCADKLRVFQISREEQIIGAPPRDRDADTRLVDILNFLQG